MSPSKKAVLSRELNLALEAARKRGDIAAMMRALGQLTALSRSTSSNETSSARRS